MFRAFSKLLGQRDSSPVQPGSESQAQAASLPTSVTSPTGLDWRSSPAHLLLLSKHLHGQALDYAEADYWQGVLHEPGRRAVDRFVRDGALEHADLHTRLAYKYKVPDLKALLKERSLPVSGRKDDLIERLMAADSPGMERAVAEVQLVQCTETGRQIAEQYLEAERQKRTAAEQAVVAALNERRFREASVIVSRFEASQVFARGMGIDWATHSPDRDIAVLAYIFNSRPKILAKVSDEHLQQLRLAAGAMYVWGTNRTAGMVPLDFATGLVMDNDAAARMCEFYALHRVELDEWRQTGFIKSATISVANDGCCCPACQKLQGKRYRIDQLPELPYEKCTSEMGCRCMALADVG
jgi:hypothetical protein